MVANLQYAADTVKKISFAVRNTPIAPNVRLEIFHLPTTWKYLLKDFGYGDPQQADTAVPVLGVKDSLDFGQGKSYKFQDCFLYSKNYGILEFSEINIIRCVETGKLGELCIIVKY